MMNKIYIVKYCGGSYEDWYSTNIFATTGCVYIQCDY